jgi:ABC-type amino acid transport substrate-binding protein
MKLFLTAMMVIASLFQSSAYSSDLDAILKNKKLRIAVDTTYPPMEFEGDDGKPTGLDVDLAVEIAKRLKVSAEFIVMPWDGILAGLKSNRYDMIMSSMNITDERKQQVNFVPYISMGQVFLTKKNAPKITKEKELAGLVVAVQADTTSYTAVENFKKSGIAIKEIKAFKNATETFSAIKANQAQAVVIDEAVGLYYSGMDSKSFSVTGQAMKPEPIGIAIAKTDIKLQTTLTNIMKQIKDDGTFKNIYKKWLKADPK